MKNLKFQYFSLVFIGFMLISISDIKSQCSLGVQGLVADLDATTLQQNSKTNINCCFWAGEYVRLTNVAAGKMYTVETCGFAGASMVTIFNPSSVGFAFNANGCGDDGVVTFTAPVSGIYIIQVNGPNCDATNRANHPIFITSLSAAPVKLSDFEVKTTSNNRVSLYWTTESETNADYFAIQHSYDGFLFEDIAIVDATGNHDTNKKYRYDDKYQRENLNYYRLKIVDKDGYSEYSEIRSIKLLRQNGVMIFPNPSSGKFNINPSESQGPELKIRVYNIQGREMGFYKLANHQIAENNIDITHLPKGMYYIKVNNAKARRILKL